MYCVAAVHLILASSINRYGMLVGEVSSHSRESRERRFPALSRWTLTNRVSPKSIDLFLRRHGVCCVVELPSEIPSLSLSLVFLHFLRLLIYLPFLTMSCVSLFFLFLISFFIFLVLFILLFSILLFLLIIIFNL